MIITVYVDYGVMAVPSGRESTALLECANRLESEIRRMSTGGGSVCTAWFQTLFGCCRLVRWIVLARTMVRRLEFQTIN